MTHYFFHFRAGAEVVPDLEGEDYPNLAAAHMDAVEAARDMVAEFVRAGASLESRAIEISDGDGNVVDAVPLSSVVRLQ